MRESSGKFFKNHLERANFTHFQNMIQTFWLIQIFQRPFNCFQDMFFLIKKKNYETICNQESWIMGRMPVTALFQTWTIFGDWLHQIIRTGRVSYGSYYWLYRDSWRSFCCLLEPSAVLLKCSKDFGCGKMLSHATKDLAKWKRWGF